MTEYLGTNVLATVVPFTSEDKFPVVLSEHIKGGYHEVATTAERDLIPTERLSNGMACYVTSESKLYIYNSTTSTWVERTTNWGSITGTLSNQTDLQTALDNKLTKNTNITGSTKCKITYDSKGLVTGGADLTSSDIPSIPLSKISNVTASASELNILDGVTASTTELNVLDGITASTSELNVLDGITATTEELNLLSGITSDLTKLENITASADELNILDGATLSTTELNYVDGVTSSIQDQLNSKQPTLSSSNAGTGISITTENNVVKINNTQTSAEWGNITGTLSDQTDLQNALDAKQPTLTSQNAGTGVIITTVDNVVKISSTGSGEASSWGHISGTLSDQIDLQNALDAKQATLTSNNAGTGISITTVDNVLKINNTQTFAEWGNITGTLSSQTDLQNALNAKQPTLTSANAGTGISITTVNDNVIITNTGTTANASWGNITGTLSDQTDLQDILDTKQDELTPFTTAEINSLFL